MNTRDIPGFWLNRSAQAEAVLAEVGSDNLFIEHDFYHTQIMEGDLATTFKRLKDQIARPDRRQSGPPRARHRQDQLCVPVRAARRGRL
ncbi:MAG: hypothetical protein U1E17_09290 [Geminicoccaceae bacterium]